MSTTQSAADSGLAAERRTRDPLLQPFTLKKLRLRNRIMSTSHAAGIDDAGMPGERYQRYHEEKAKGGLALTMFGGSSMVAPDSSWGAAQINVGVDAVIPYLQQFSARVHGRGAAIMCQISHLGRRGEALGASWLPTLAPSPIRERKFRSFPREMDEDDITRVVREYAAAARRCQEGGLDGVETVTGGHLIGQFLSPRTNRRTDRFGGSSENRARFGLMVHEAIRKAVGDDYIVGMRFVVDEGEEAGSPENIDLEECIRLAQIFERAGTIDFFNAIFGRMDTALALAEHNMPVMSQAIGGFLKTVGAFKREVRLPIFHAARISDLASARHAVAEGLVDMVGMMRAHIADPHLVAKLMRGEEERIRPCVGATHCLWKKIACIHNPATGREAILPQIVPRAERPGRRIVVVGGGPGGLEAARVAAERGHKVTLLEAAPRLGGQLLIASRATWRKDLIGIVRWREAELARLGVDVRLNTLAEPDDVLALTPEAVIVATGGAPDLGWLDGGEHATTTWDALLEPTTVKENVIIFDATGRDAGVSTALHFVEQGRNIHLVMLDEVVATEMDYGTRAKYRQQLARNRVTLSVDLQLVGVAPRGNRLAATFRHELTDEIVEHVADQVIVENGTMPVCDVFDGLKARAANRGITDIERLLAMEPQLVSPPSEGVFELHRIGDAVSSRNIHAAIHDALRLVSVM